MKQFNEHLEETIVTSIYDKHNLLMLEGSSNFNAFASDFDELCDLPQFQDMKDIPNLKNLIEDIIEYVKEKNNLPESNIFRYSEAERYFTLYHATFKDAILKQKDRYPEDFKIVYNEHDEKVWVYSLKVRRPHKNLLFRTSKKANNVVPTAAQENSTCKIFNTFMSDPEKSLDVEDVNVFAELVQDQEAAEYFDVSWYQSFGRQLDTMVNFIKDSLNEDPYEYRAVRYGETYNDPSGEVEQNVAKAYKKFVSTYAKKLGMSKDACDPTDIILFKYKKGSDIKALLDGFTKRCNAVPEGDPEGILKGIREEYLNKLVLDGSGDIKHLFIPISLKKIGSKGGSYETMNVKDGLRICKISDASLTYTDTNLTIDCTGKFDLKGFTDEDGTPAENPNTVKLVMRTFGSGNVAIDCSVVIGKKTCPTLGKVPVDMWRPFLGCKKNEDISSCIQKFLAELGFKYEFTGNKSPRLNVDKKNFDVLDGLVRDAAKAGPNCLPFVIIH